MSYQLIKFIIEICNFTEMGLAQKYIIQGMTVVGVRSAIGRLLVQFPLHLPLTFVSLSRTLVLVLG